MRVPTRKQKPRTAQVKSWPSPRSGWISNRNLAQPGARGPDGTPISGAQILDNFFPTATTARLRRGYDEYADITGGTIGSMFAYLNGNNRKIFAADNDKIVDVTTVTVTDEVTGLTSSDWISTQFATAGGVFLRLVNGEDTPLVYDGAAFSTAPALTFAAPDGALTPDILNFVWAFANRLFFVEKESLNAWYLGAGEIGGELTKFPLSGVFERGGSLLFGTIWSNDSGNQGGLSEQCVFVSTEGEVAVYQGSNPGDANDWRKVGVYRIGRPLGKRAWFRAGGDVVIATTVGLISLASAVSKDFAALAPTAVSYPIEDAWNDAVHARGEGGWQCEVWAAQQMALVIPPYLYSLEKEIFVVNLRTGAWCRFTGWDMRSVVVFEDRMFFGSVEGRINEALTTGYDKETPYTGVYVPLFEDLGTPANKKIVRLARATFRARPDGLVLLGMHVDFRVELPVAPDTSPVQQRNEWGSAIWGSSTWGEGSDLETIENWQSVAAAGYAIAPSLQVTSGDLVPLDVEIVRIDATYTVGGIVT